jgi:uncharacterized repeat protein (TIGR03803 family)
MQKTVGFAYLGPVKRALGILVAASLLGATALAAGNERVVYSFTGGSDGADPAVALLFDASGNAYGTAVSGGADGCGTAYMLKPVRGQWQQTLLHTFSCDADGKNPYGGLVADATGTLYGTTVAGGSGGICNGDGCGTVFALTPSGETVLHNFTGNPDGAGPGGALTFDKSGNLFGTTPDGGKQGVGTIYELARAGSTWKYRVIHTFTGGNDGATGSLGALLPNAAGDLFGVTEGGGTNGLGTVYKLSPMGAKWRLTTLYAFKGQPDAAFPYGGLIANKRGTLYGTTYYGGPAGQGTVFALTHDRRHGWTERVVYAFSGGADGGNPTSTLVIDGAGALLGTASDGGDPSCGCGVVFSVDPSTGKESVLHTFGGAHDGTFPNYGLTAGGKGVYYSTAPAGGTQNQGAIFAVNVRR